MIKLRPINRDQVRLLGLEDLLEPWLVKGEEESRFGTFEKEKNICQDRPDPHFYLRKAIGRPNSFAEARQTEKVCVAYAKEVR